MNFSPPSQFQLPSSSAPESFPDRLAQQLGQLDAIKLAGKHKEAIELANKFLCLDPTEALILDEIGDNYLSLREYGKAIKALNRAIALAPLDANAWYLRGFVHGARGDFHASVDDLSHSLALQPEHPEILRCLGWSTFHKGDRPKGLKLLTQAHALAPTDDLILCDWAVCELNERNFAEAARLAKLAQGCPNVTNPAKVADLIETIKSFEAQYGAKPVKPVIKRKPRAPAKPTKPKLK